MAAQENKKAARTETAERPSASDLPRSKDTPIMKPFEPKTAKREMKGMASEAET